MVSSAIICEGAAESAIIDLLLDQNKLIITRDDLIDGRVIKVRGGKKFASTYLRKSFANKIKIYRVLDSRSEKFNLPTLYLTKVEVINVITAPEIEMLIIHAEDKYNEFKKSKKKPSDFCKQDLRMTEVKKYEFITGYFCDVNKLIDCINLHKKKARQQSDEIFLADLLVVET